MLVCWFVSLFVCWLVDWLVGWLVCKHVQKTKVGRAKKVRQAKPVMSKTVYDLFVCAFALKRHDFACLFVCLLVGWLVCMFV